MPREPEAQVAASRDQALASLARPLSGGLDLPGAAYRLPTARHSELTTERAIAPSIRRNTSARHPLAAATSTAVHCVAAQAGASFVHLRQRPTAARTPRRLPFAGGEHVAMDHRLTMQRKEATNANVYTIVTRSRTKAWLPPRHRPLLQPHEHSAPTVPMTSRGAAVMSLHY